MVHNSGGNLFTEQQSKPSWDDLRSGLYFANSPMERERIQALVRKGLTMGQAIHGARFPEYARHALAFDEPLTPGQFIGLQADAKRLGIALHAALAEKGYRTRTTEADPVEDAMAKLNRLTVEEHEWWNTRPLPDGDTEDAPSLSVLARSASKTVGMLDSVRQRIEGAGKGRRRQAPSQTPLGRRARLIRAKAKQLGITEAEAERLTPHKSERTIAL
jgi:hypothetical protein